MRSKRSILALRPGVTYADVRVIESRDRELGTKNGKPGQVSSAESVGIGIRVLADGCWGFAATDDLTHAGIESAAALAVDIARSSALAKKHDVTLAPEDEARSHLGLALPDRSVLGQRRRTARAAHRSRRRTAPQFRRDAGANLHDLSPQPPDLRLFASAASSIRPAPPAAPDSKPTAFKDDEIQKRSYPNSFGGQHQFKGYELIHELDLLAARAARRRRGRGAALGRSMPRRAASI